MKITVIGIGRLGLCTALCLEKAGHHVVGVDIYDCYVQALNNKTFDSSEPYVNELLQRSVNFSATTDLKAGLDHSNVCFVVVDTPNGGGENFYDHTKLSRLLCTINRFKVKDKILVVSCTVMPKYITTIGKELLCNCENTTLNYSPEFVAQGQLISGFSKPDVVLIGAEDETSGATIRTIYESFVESNPVYCVMSPLEAEITKIAINGFITTKIAYANMIGDLCENTGSNPDVVLKAVGSDSRIGNKYFRYGPSFGGPCFPRDTHALSRVLKQNNTYNHLIEATHQNNQEHILHQADRKTENPIVIEGVSYKAEDRVPIIEESNNVKVALELTRRGKKVVLRDTKKLLDLVRMEYGNRFTYQEYKRKKEKKKEKEYTKTVVVFGAGGFIGSHLTERLRKEGCYVVGVDLKYPQFGNTHANRFYIRDLRDSSVYNEIIPKGCDELYQLAADMGGAEYIFTGNNDSEILHNSALINLHTCEWAVRKKVKSVFYSSSACVYASTDSNKDCPEDSAYPANPDSDYGWEKLFSERLYLAYKRNHNLNVHIARYHNVAGPKGTWRGGKEKAPAAICRKVAEAKDGGEIEIFGDGEQTRTFLHISDCIEGTLRLMRSNWEGPCNIGSSERISINGLVDLVSEISGKTVNVKHIDGPLGVRGRSSNNDRIFEKLGWKPIIPLEKTMLDLYVWIARRIPETIRFNFSEKNAVHLDKTIEKINSADLSDEHKLDYLEQNYDLREVIAEIYDEINDPDEDEDNHRSIIRGMYERVEEILSTKESSEYIDHSYFKHTHRILETYLTYL